MLASIGETVANDSWHARGRLAPAIYLRETFPPERKAPMPLGPYTIDSTWITSGNARPNSLNERVPRVRDCFKLSGAKRDQGDLFTPILYILLASINIESFKFVQNIHIILNIEIIYFMYNIYM